MRSAADTAAPPRRRGRILSRHAPRRLGGRAGCRIVASATARLHGARAARVRQAGDRHRVVSQQRVSQRRPPPPPARPHAREPIGVGTRLLRSARASRRPRLRGARGPRSPGLHPLGERRRCATCASVDCTAVPPRRRWRPSHASQSEPASSAPARLGRRRRRRAAPPSPPTTRRRSTRMVAAAVGSSSLRRCERRAYRPKLPTTCQHRVHRARSTKNNASSDSLSGGAPCPALSSRRRSARPRGRERPAPGARRGRAAGRLGRARCPHPPRDLRRPIRHLDHLKPRFRATRRRRCRSSPAVAGEPQRPGRSSVLPDPAVSSHSFVFWLVETQRRSPKKLAAMWRELDACAAARSPTTRRSSRQAAQGRRGRDLASAERFSLPAARAHRGRRRRGDGARLQPGGPRRRLRATRARLAVA